MSNPLTAEEVEIDRTGNGVRFVLRWDYREPGAYHKIIHFKTEEAAVLVRDAIRKAFPEGKAAVFRITHEEVEIP